MWGERAENEDDEGGLRTTQQTQHSRHNTTQQTRTQTVHFSESPSCAQCRVREGDRRLDRDAFGHLERNFVRMPTCPGERQSEPCVPTDPCRAHSMFKSDFKLAMAWSLSHRNCMSFSLSSSQGFLACWRYPDNVPAV
jgi:hypothetical protein